jgi:hypothetical protein
LKARRPGRWARAVAKIGLLLVAPAVCVAEYHEVDDIKPFGLLDVSGHVRVGYLFDDRERGASLEKSFEQQSSWEEEIFVLTRSFIYHPGFLNMDFGGGPVFVQQQFDTNVDSATNDDVLFNFLGRLNLLELKTYPVSVYYERTHPSVTTNRSGRFLVQNDVYGVSGHISGLLRDRTSARYAITRRDAAGSGLGSVVDTAADTKTFALQSRYRNSDSIEFRFDKLDQVSASGSAGLPIVRSELDQTIAEVHADNVFGAAEQFRVSQRLRRMEQENVTTVTSTLDDRVYNGNIQWQYNSDGRMFFNLRDATSKRESTRQDVTDLEFGASEQLTERTFARGSVAHSAVDQTGFRRDRSSVRGSADYSRETGFGGISISGSARAERNDQESTADTIDVFDEPLLLVGTTPVDLRNEFVVDGSVVVRNVDKTQTYLEGLDYRLIVTGTVTSVQRLVNSGITDGETVLVDYSYSTSGTAEYDTLGSGIAFRADFLRTFRAHVRYDWQDSKVRAGELTNPLNDGEILEFGVGTSNQFLDGWTLDAQYRHLQQDVETSPFVSDQLEVSVTTSLRGTLSLTLAGGLNETDYENSDEDVSQVTYRVGLRGLLFRRSYFAYDAFLLDDTGGSLARKQLRHRLHFQWNYRQMRFDLRATLSDDELGISERNNTTVTAQLTRVF